MQNYQEQPCSVYLPRGIEKRAVHQQPIEESPEEEEIVEPVVPAPKKSVPKEKTEASAKEAAKKKSCLTTVARKPTESVHPALRKKTVAFGRTVNVSQTIEGTSRASRRSNNMTSKSPNKQMDEEDKENYVKRSEVEGLKNEMKTVMENSTQMMREIRELSQCVRDLTMKSINDSKEKENARLVDNERNRQVAVVTNKSIPSGNFLNASDFAILDKRMGTDPIFRQKVFDVIADAKDEENRDRRSSPVNVRWDDQDRSDRRDRQYRSDGITTPKSVIRETQTVTLERSIHCDPLSIDSRKWLETAGNRRRESPENVDDEHLHSTYVPGNSFSYYPSRQDDRHRRKNNRYIVEDASEGEDETTTTRRGKEKTTVKPDRAELERIFRAKYARK